MSNSRIRSVRLAIALALSFAGCRAQEPAAMDATRVRAADSPKNVVPKAGPAQNAPSLVMDRAGIQCAAMSGKTSCTAGSLERGDYYDVELHANCDADGLFAGVAQQGGADALAQIPATGSNGHVNGHLPQGQLVCIQATGRIENQASYYFVQALAPSQAPASCSNNPDCAAYASTANANCSATEEKNPCSHGWVDVAALDMFDGASASQKP